MKRYVISLLVFLAGIGLSILLTWNSLMAFVDIPSLACVGIFPFLFVSILFGFRDMAAAFSVAVKKEAEKVKLLKAVDFFKFYEKITWIAGIIGVLMGMIGMLRNLDDASSIGPNMALALISIFYCGIFNAVVILPFTLLLKKQLTDRE